MAVMAAPRSLLREAGALGLVVTVAAATGVLLAAAAVPTPPRQQEAQQAPLQVLMLTLPEELVPAIALWPSPQHWAVLQCSLPLCLSQTPQ